MSPPLVASQLLKLSPEVNGKCDIGMWKSVILGCGMRTIWEL